MSAPEIPTTEDVRTDWMAARHNGGGVPWDDAEAEFDAWLAARDAETVKNVLSAAAWALDCEADYPLGSMAQDAAVEWLRARATAHTDPEEHRP